MTFLLKYADYYQIVVQIIFSMFSLTMVHYHTQRFLSNMFINIVYVTNFESFVMAVFFAEIGAVEASK